MTNLQTYSVMHQFFICKIDDFAFMKREFTFGNCKYGKQGKSRHNALGM